MRSLPIICGVLLCVHGAMAAGENSMPRIGVSASALRNMRASLSGPARKSLAGTITQAQQLKILRTDPSLAARLQQLGVGVETHPMGNDPWQSGIAVAPLTPLFPANATYDSFRLSLQTRAAWLSPFSPLPSSSQNPPLLWLNVASNSDPLFWVEAKWPSTGVYLVTCFMKDLWPNSIAKPRFFKSGSGMQTAVSNVDSGGDRWTFLWEANNPQDLEDEVSVYPSESGFGFTCCCLSKVVISKIL
ncbi:MAG: hypothetical protein ABFE07_12985 [Armatimonadia bacterium]